MTETQFAALLGAYGADLARWPEAERARAELFLRSAPHRMRDIWDSERSFDDLLALEADAPASLALEAAILRQVRPAAPARAGGLRLAWPSRPQWATGGALAASLALGLAVGYAGEPRAQGDHEYARMLTVSGGGAGAVLLTAIDEGSY